jgi:PIN domain nuclease of toxin-antitoxin system
MLPFHHRDPFDRLLIAQAATDGLSVVTSDQRFASYGIHVIW